MPRPRTYKTRAIVLSRFDLGEADRVLTLLTPEEGASKAVAKGVRRPGSRIGGAVEPFAELELLLARAGPSMSSPRSVSHAWLGCEIDLNRPRPRWYVGELAHRAVEERAGALPVYGLLRRAYQLLDDGMAPGRVARWFETNLADALGVRPELERCVECHRVLEEEDRFRWVPALGGVLCRPPAGPRRRRSAISLPALKLLRAYRRFDIEATRGAATPSRRGSGGRGGHAPLRPHTLERDARSLAFFDEVRHTHD